MPSTTTDTAMLLFGDRRAPRPLRAIPVADRDDIDAAVRDHRRLIIVGDDADLGAVLTRLLRTERLDTEVAFVSRRRSPATRAYGVSTGYRGARRALSGVARRVPLIRDDRGMAIAGAATWRGVEGATLRGEAVVDDTTLFDGVVAGVRVEPTGVLPGLRAAVLSGRGRPRRWVTGRAAQLGSTGVLVARDGVTAARPVPRSTFYRHTEGWVLVR